MSILTAAVTSIVNLFSTSSPNSTGAEAVRTAISEVENLQDKEFSGTLGEPDIVEDGGLYFKSPKVFIPIHNAPFKGVNRLVFDLPDGRNDSRSRFLRLLEEFDLDFESMEDLDGETVPMTFIGGNATVLWHQLDDSDKGAEDSPPEDDGDDAGVNIAETTISTEEDDA